MEMTFSLKKSSDFIFEHLTDMQKFASAHPVISKIERIENETYLVHETLKFGLIPLSFTYPVTIEKDSLANTVAFNATVFKLIKIRMKFSLKPDSERTVVDESIQFKSLLPVKFIMGRVFRKQHIQLFKNMETKL